MGEMVTLTAADSHGAEHGFNCWQRPDTSCHAPSAALALERRLALFDRHIAR
jgi:hypothetical protein